MSVERTFAEDVLEVEDAILLVDKLYEELVRRLEKHQERPIRNQQVKLKFSDFRTTTIERHSPNLEKHQFLDLLPRAWERGNGLGIRLLGLGVTFRELDQVSEKQLKLF